MSGYTKEIEKLRKRGHKNDWIIEYYIANGFTGTSLEAIKKEVEQTN